MKPFDTPSAWSIVPSVQPMLCAWTLGKDTPAPMCPRQRLRFLGSVCLYVMNDCLNRPGSSTTHKQAALAHDSISRECATVQGRPERAAAARAWLRRLLVVLMAVAEVALVPLASAVNSASICALPGAMPNACTSWVLADCIAYAGKQACGNPSNKQEGSCSREQVLVL